ncbi:DsbA family protein [Sphingomonas sp.]|jgi:protein-disulfide isomerase|uniref:DsbA family protein n=1 Tax=Sphingomonas sp. TaxID=28214 RepID=UPI002DE4A647|nr:DsbA family protein [Sphingomonas sp.]
MTRWLSLVAVALLSSVGTAVAFTALDRKQDTRAYLLEHPEVLQEAMEKLRMKQAAAQIAPLRRDLETPFAQGFMGAPKGDVTIVQFFDYACGYCRTSLADLQRLVREDPKVRVVFREYPILSRESETAARASLVAAQQGRYAAFHTAMYAAGRPSAAGVIRAAQTAGLDMTQLQTAMQAPDKEQELVNNVALARTLGFSGTPSWVIGDQAMSGAVGYEALKEAVAKVRASRT